MKATKLNAAVKVIAKIVEVMLWIATAVYAGMLVALVVAGAPLVRWVQEGLDSGNLFIVGDPNLLPVASDATVLARGFAVAAIAMVAMLGMMAVVFRNIHLIFSTSETESPFTKANVQRVRRIGELSIIAPIINTIFMVVVDLVVGSRKVEFFVNMQPIAFGLVVLCLAQFFAYGAELEHDVDGLL